MTRDVHPLPHLAHTLSLSHIHTHAHARTHNPHTRHPILTFPTSTNHPDPTYPRSEQRSRNPHSPPCAHTHKHTHTHTTHTIHCALSRTILSTQVLSSAKESPQAALRAHTRRFRNNPQSLGNRSCHSAYNTCVSISVYGNHAGCVGGRRCACAL